MTDATKDFRDVLEADARRRAMFGGQATAKPADPAEHTGSWDVRFRLVNTFPRETRPLFAALRGTLAPYGYTLSPLHPAHDLSRPRMQAELARVAPEDPARFAPLVFELDPGTTSVRIFVRQYGGRPAPDFAERTIDIGGPPDLPALEAVLKDYIVCMLEAAPSALAA